MDNRTRLTSYRTIAEALIKAHVSHKTRAVQMIILWNMIRIETERIGECEYQNCLYALMEILTHVTTNTSPTKGDLTHSGAKAALNLFSTTATATIMSMYVPETRNSDDYIPF